MVQHIWSRWDKASRGANAPVRRPRLRDAYPVPADAEPGEVVLHDIRDLDREANIFECVGPVTRDDWSPPELSWRRRGQDFEFTINDPSPHRRQTRWPGWLPSPLVVLRPGEMVCIDWNARFRFSLFGSNRSSYYEQHRYWLANADAVASDMFLTADPRKHIDLRGHIY